MVIHNTYSVWSVCPICKNMDMKENHILFNDEYYCDECYFEVNDGK